MTGLDERILEDVAESDDELTAWEIAFDLEARLGLVRHRCEVLAHAGFLERRERPHLDAKHEITTWGSQYLDGDVDADLRRPLPKPRPPHAVRPGWWAGFG
jgi:repressor of nif and glnA expression